MKKTQDLDHYKLFKEYWKQLLQVAVVDKTELTDRPVLQSLIEKLKQRTRRLSMKQAGNISPVKATMALRIFA